MKPLSTGKFFILLGVIYITLFIFLVVHREDEETMADRYTREKVLLVGNEGDPNSLDPAFAITVRDRNIVDAIFEALLIHDPETLAPRPGVAQDWKVSADGLVYTFYLRRDAYFSNGDNVTAHDFVFAIKRILSPKLRSPNAVFLEDVKNAKNYYEGVVTNFNEVGVRALDDYTLQFTLDLQNPYFTVVIAYWFLVPLHQKTLEKFDAVDNINNEWYLPENFVGNGPFTLKKWLPNQYIEAERNPYYWGAKDVKLNKIQFYSMGSPENEAQAFCRGKLHVVTNLSSKHAAYCEHHLDPHLRTVELNGLDMYIFNTEVPPLNDPRVRQALSIGIIRENVINDVVNGVFKNDRKIAYNFISKIVPGYRPSKYVKEDIEKARALLAEAGFPNGAGFPQLELLIPDAKTHIGVAKAVQDMWRRHLNIGIKIVTMDWNEVYDRLDNRDYQIIRMGWANDAMDPLSVMENFSRAKWRNERFIHAFESARNSPDIPTRYRYVAEAESVLIDEVPIMPLFFFVRNSLIHPDVVGWRDNSACINYYQFIDLIYDPRLALTPQLCKIPYYITY